MNDLRRPPRPSLAQVVDRLDRLIAVTGGEPDPAQPLHVDQHLPVKALAKYAGVHEKTLAKAIKDPIHPLPSYRLPGMKRVRVRWGDFLEWRESLTRSTHEEARKILIGLVE